MHEGVKFAMGPGLHKAKPKSFDTLTGLNLNGLYAPLDDAWLERIWSCVTVTSHTEPDCRRLGKSMPTAIGLAWFGRLLVLIIAQWLLPS